MQLLQMSVSAGVFIGAVCLVRLLTMKRLPKSAFVLLWQIALFRLLIPFPFHSPLSVFRLFEKNAELGSVLWRVNAGANGISQELSIPQAVDPSLLVWAAGFLLAAVLFLLLYFREHNRLATALPERESPLIQDFLKANTLRRPLRVMVSDRVSSPLACGIFRPRVILPSSMDPADEKRVQVILTHEMEHIRHLDALWKLLSIAALCLHWFNPMAWLLVFLLGRDLELACDERVLRRYGAEGRADYALSLLEMAEKKFKLTPFCSGFGKKAVKERIVLIMNYKKTSFSAILLSAALVVGTTTVFASSAPQVEPKAVRFNAVRLEAVPMDTTEATTFKWTETVTVDENTETGALTASIKALPADTSFSFLAPFGSIDFSTDELKEAKTSEEMRALMEKKVNQLVDEGKATREEADAFLKNTQMASAISITE